MDGIFIWNDASWDVQGVYPESTTEGQGSYRDPVVVAMIEAHNAAVAAGGRAPDVSAVPPGGGTAPYADSARPAVAAASAVGGR